MSTEIELKLQLTPKSARKLAEHPLLAGIPPRKLRLLNTYYDTPDLTLHARRIAMRFRKKGPEWLLTVKTAEPACGGLAVRNEWETAANPGIFDFSHVDQPTLQDFLVDATPHLGAIFTTDFRRQIWHVPYGESMIELALDRGAIESRGRATPICEIELELLSGKLDDIFGLTRKLQDKLDLRPAIASKAERGYQLFLDQPLRPFRAKPAPVDASMTPVEAFRSIALGCLEHFQRNEAGLLASEDPEFIHQARVALRRLRSAIKLFSPVLPAEFVRTYSTTWKTLAGALGEARNWDVFLNETLPPIQKAFPDDHELKRLRHTAQKRTKAARRTINSLLAIGEYPRLITEFTAAVYALGSPLPMPIDRFVRNRIKKRIQAARSLAEQHEALNNYDRHRMRIAFKKLRYTLEFFQSLEAGHGLPLYQAALTQLQDVLGLINDHATAEILIQEVQGNRPKGIARGWISGRHALLIESLAQAIRAWRAQALPIR